MRLPRDLSADDLVYVLSALGYVVTQPTGSHTRLVTLDNGEHHATIPKHDPLRLGTLSSVLADVAEHFGLTRDELLKKLFER